MDDQIRIYQVARVLRIANQDVIRKLRDLGYEVKSHSAKIDQVIADRLIANFEKQKEQPGAFEKEQSAQARLKLRARKKQRPSKGLQKPPSDDADDLEGGMNSSAVPKRPYPGDDDTSVRLPVPEHNNGEIP